MGFGPPLVAGSSVCTRGDGEYRNHSRFILAVYCIRKRVKAPERQWVSLREPSFTTTPTAGWGAHFSRWLSAQDPFEVGEPLSRTRRLVALSYLLCFPVPSPRAIQGAAEVSGTKWDGPYATQVGFMWGAMIVRTLLSELYRHGPASKGSSWPLTRSKCVMISAAEVWLSGFLTQGRSLTTCNGGSSQ